MDYFYNIEFKKGVITVLGAETDSPFVSDLVKCLEAKGTVCLTEDKYGIDENADFSVIVPDKNVNKRFIVHSESDIAYYKEKGAVIGLLSIESLLKDIADAVVDAEVFCSITNMAEGDLVYPLALAKVIENREKYDMLYIDDISNMDRRYTAREINRRIKYGAGVRIINTDTDYVEELLTRSGEEL